MEAPVGDAREVDDEDGCDKREEEKEMRGAGEGEWVVFSVVW